MEKMIFTTQYFEPFTSTWNVKCLKIPYENGYIIPLGWEEELTKRGIDFEIIDYEPPQTEDLI